MSKEAYKFRTYSEDTRRERDRRARDRKVDKRESRLEALRTGDLQKAVATYGTW